jgi:hypothetical protein
MTVAENEAMGILLTGVERMTDIIGRCRIYEHLFLDKEPSLEVENLQVALIKLYALILRFLANASRSYDASTSSRAVDAILNPNKFIDFLKDFEHLEKQVHYEVDICHKTNNEAAQKELLDQGESLMQLLKTWDDPIIRVDSGVAKLCVDLDKRMRLKILTWLSKIEYEKLHNTARQNRMLGTGKWLLTHDKYLEWRRSSASMILWLSGVRRYSVTM